MKKFDKVKIIERSILNAHVSTRERSAYMEEFVRVVQKLIRGDHTIVDIGAGVFPLALPLVDLMPHIYLAVDTNRDSIRVLDTYQKTLPQDLLHTYHGNFSDISWEHYVGKGGSFDTALMLKLVSAVRRRSKRLYKRLAEVPAMQILVSVPKEALTRNESIARRETGIVKEFAKLAGKEIVEKYDFPNEVLFVLR